MTSEHGASDLAKRLDKLYEFERAPVTPDKLHSGRYFAGMFAGEHIAATEFVIGALFVSWGVSARDLIFGLLLGNALAVLSWAFICAPIAVRVRLTLYWYARRIIGPGLTVIYNIVNALLYCFLAAAMIGVSASAVLLAINKIFKTELVHPELHQVLPPDRAWILIVLAVGAVVVVLAIAGFKKLSQFAAVCSPWMFLIFIAGAIATLPRLGEFHNAADLWDLLETKVWTGTPYEAPLRSVTTVLTDVIDGGPLSPPLRNELGSATDEGAALVFSDTAVIHTEVPAERWRIVDPEANKEYVIKYVDEVDENGVAYWTCKIFEVQPKLYFWHIAFFAWFCNLAMHIGLSDMAVFRYAKHWTYGFYSAFGMYLGHYLAWACAGIMGAVLGGTLNPGAMADEAAGIAGMLAVLIAGWTTANPTIYRAGLALQIVTPNWPRWKVTLAAGGITTIVACFPFIFLRLLDFVAIYGLTLMPIGAVIVTEHWVFPKLGLRQYWSDKRKLSINPPALIAWLVVLALCFPFEAFTGGRIQSPAAMLGIHLFFRWLPGWFIAAGTYIILCFIMGERSRGEPDEVVVAAQQAAAGAPAAVAATKHVPHGPLFWASGAVALLALVLCVALPLRVFFGAADAYAENMVVYKQWLMVATVLYFVGAIVWASLRQKAENAGA